MLHTWLLVIVSGHLNERNWLLIFLIDHPLRLKTASAVCAPSLAHGPPPPLLNGQMGCQLGENRMKRACLLLISIALCTEVKGLG